MTMQGAKIELINLLNDKNLPIYYEPMLKKVIETIEQEQSTVNVAFVRNIRTEIEKRLSDIDYLESICPFGSYGEWYDGVKDAEDIVLEVIDNYTQEVSERS